MYYFEVWWNIFDNVFETKVENKKSKFPLFRYSNNNVFLFLKFNINCQLIKQRLITLIQSVCCHCVLFLSHATPQYNEGRVNFSLHVIQKYILFRSVVWYMYVPWRTLCGILIIYNTPVKFLSFNFINMTHYSESLSLCWQLLPVYKGRGAWATSLNWAIIII